MLYYFFLFLFASYTINKEEGSVTVHAYFYGDKKAKDPIDIHYDIYYKGSESIQQVPLLLFTKDSIDKKKYFKIQYYSYLNPETNTCDVYGSLSDTAALIKHYTSLDSISLVGGWNFIQMRYSPMQKQQILQTLPLVI